MKRNKISTNQKTYHRMVAVSKKVLLALQVGRIDGIKTTEEGFEIRSIRSGLYLHGGFAPKEIKELLSYHHLHKMRKTWLDKLFPYFSPFMQNVSKKQMWEAIKEQRLVFKQSAKKRDSREEEDYWRVDPNHKFIDYMGEYHKDKYPRVLSRGTERLFPMLGHKYVEFLLSLSNKRLAILNERWETNLSSYNISHLKNNRKDLEKLTVTFSGLPVDKFAIADNPFCYGYAEEFRIAISGGRFRILEMPSRDYALGHRYISKKGVEYIEKKRGSIQRDAEEC